MDPSKRPWLSKTLWINVLVGLSPLIPGSEEYLNPKTMLQLFAVVNILLRLVTKKSISFE